MYTIVQKKSSKYVVSKSKFCGYAMPISSEQDARDCIKYFKEHSNDLNHVCYAFRLVNDDGSILEKCSDHGEPSGTAGKPILNVLRSNEIVNTIIVVTRSFGGILLGIPGLIKAYKTTAELALKNTKKISYIAYEYKKETITIQEYDSWKHNLEKQGGIIVNVNFGLLIEVEYKIVK